MKRLMLLVILLVLSPITFANSELMPATKLFQLMNQRLSYMKDVAAYKYKRNMSTFDKKREKVVLTAAVHKAAVANIKAQSVRPFFQAQMNAAVGVENAWVKYWQHNGLPKTERIRSLTKVVRPALIKLDDQIIKQLKLAMPLLKDQKYQAELYHKFEQSINVQYVSQKDKWQLWKSLHNVQARG